MVWAIILTLVISSLVSLVWALRERCIEKESECKRLRSSNAYLKNKLDEHRDFEIERRVKDSYKRGLYDGRETDTLYRTIVKKYAAGEQATVMIYGEPQDREGGKTK